MRPFCPVFCPLEAPFAIYLSYTSHQDSKYKASRLVTFSNGVSTSRGPLRQDPSSTAARQRLGHVLSSERSDDSAVPSTSLCLFSWCKRGLQTPRMHDRQPEIWPYPNKATDKEPRLIKRIKRAVKNADFRACGIAACRRSRKDAHVGALDAQLDPWLFLAATSDG